MYFNNDWNSFIDYFWKVKLFLMISKCAKASEGVCCCYSLFSEWVSIFPFYHNSVLIFANCGHFFDSYFSVCCLLTTESFFKLFFCKQSMILRNKSEKRMFRKQCQPASKTVWRSTFIWIKFQHQIITALHELLLNVVF